MLSFRNRNWNFITAALLTVSCLCACGHPPADSVSNAGSQKLPFDRQPSSGGVSPSQSLLPSTTKLPEGTPVPIRLLTALSSATSHTGDTFNATVDEPVVVDGQVLLARGTPAAGRVLEAKAAASSAGESLDPGYLRIALVSLEVGGRTVMIETSSIFAKGGGHEERNQLTGAASAAGSKDIVFGLDRRLNFRLALTVDLQ